MRDTATSVEIKQTVGDRATELEDLLERSRTEHATLKESETRFRILSELVSDCCWARWVLPDGATHRLWVNDAFESLTGYTPEDFAQIGRDGLVHPDDLEEVLRHVEGPEGVSELEFRIVRKDGEVRWLYEKMLVRQEGDGTVVLGATRDITERKRAEESLKAALHELRTTQAQLVQAGKLAALGQLGAGIAHELNQPLTAIQMFAEIIRSEPTSQVQEHLEHVDLIVEQSRRMARIVDNLRAFARRSDLVVGSIPALEPATDALMLMSEQLRLAGIEVEQEIGEDPGSVQGDRVQLQQVFLNLFGNALHALEELDEGQPRRLRVTIRRVGPWVEYRVEDSGRGVTHDIRHKIFDPFFTTKNVGRGTGLGLSLSYGIVKEHRGDIRYEEGQGARFVVRLPLSEDAAGEPEGPVTAAVMQAHPARRRVLVIDDEAVLRQVFERMLSSWGWDVTLAPSGEAGLGELARDTFGLVLVDIKMPGMSGIEFVELLRSRAIQTAVVAMSGYVTEEARESLKTLGVDVVLCKPVPVNVLRAALARVGDEHPGAAANL